MSEEFDKKLTERIGDVFDNFEGNSAAEGWARLRKKYPEKDTRRPIAWWWFGAAAGLLLVLGTTFWLNNNKGQNTGTKPVNTVTTLKPKARTVSPFASIPQQTNIPKPEVIQPNVGATADVNKKVIFSLKANASAKVGVSQQNSTSLALVTPNEPSHKTTQTATTVAVVPDNGNKAIQIMAATATQPKPDTGADTSTNKKDTAAKKAILAKNTTKPDAAKPNGKRVTWGVFVSAYSNFHENDVTGSTFDLGGGTSADIRLANGVSLSTGLGLFQNSLSYYPSASLSSGSYTQYTTASLLTLEVPVLLNCRVAKSGVYVAGGFSSAVYVSETDHTAYAYNNSYFSTPASQTGASSGFPPDVVTTNHFGTFIFGKTLDLAAGFGLPVGKDRIIFEPFLKYPFNHFDKAPYGYGSAGLNLRFAFGTGK